ncbi:hypothetical protein [Eubacterium aggregans]|uniref:hypothetical protein n=1 Tax=Eubacterium aggregans TaxID=81409 RepID=UPI003F368BDC
MTVTTFNDSHNLALYLKNYPKSKLTDLYLTTCVYKSLNHKYSWSNNISGKKIQSDIISLPTKDGNEDYSEMAILISAIQKLVIKDVVLDVNKKINVTKIIVKKK